MKKYSYIEHFVGINNRKRIYLGGPMRGYERYNFGAFDRGTLFLTNKGWDVISPAEIDRELGLIETDPLPDWFTIEGALRRDFAAICTCSAVGFLPKWEDSEGSQKEKTIAEFLGLDIYDVDPEKGLFKKWEK